MSFLSILFLKFVTMDRTIQLSFEMNLADSVRLLSLFFAGAARMAEYLEQLHFEISYIFACARKYVYDNFGEPWETVLSDYEEIFASDYFLPLWTMSLVMIMMIGSGILARMMLSLMYENDRFKIGLVEFLAQSHICLGAFCGIKLFEYYGYPAFIATNIVSMMTALLIYRKPSHFCLIVEEYLNEIMPRSEAVKIVCLEGMYAPIFPFIVHTYLAMAGSYTGVKADKIFHETACILPDLTSYSVVLLILATEIVGGFLIRCLLTKIDTTDHPRRIYLLPFYNAVSFSCSLYMIGMPGCDLTISLSRAPHCFVATTGQVRSMLVAVVYGVPTFLGWWLHRQLSPLPATLRSPWAEINKDFAETKAIAASVRVYERQMAEEQERRNLENWTRQQSRNAKRRNR
uniref:Transmembrane protein n=1 Tax=Caenorhabditis tropicalis TaxID=1561998 RepID=A0A1I7UFZ0_9PELO